MKKFDVDSGLIRRLAELLDETGLSEIEIGEGERRVRVARGTGGFGGAAGAMGGAAAAFQPSAEAAAAAAPAAEADATTPGAVTSPMVGTVYTSQEPGAPPFVAVGGAVSEGQTLFIIEAMKVMNPIRAPHAGTVKQILVSNGDPVEYGEVLLVLE